MYESSDECVRLNVIELCKDVMGCSTATEIFQGACLAYSDKYLQSDKVNNVLLATHIARKISEIKLDSRSSGILLTANILDTKPKPINGMILPDCEILGSVPNDIKAFGLSDVEFYDPIISLCYLINKFISLIPENKRDKFDELSESVVEKWKSAYIEHYMSDECVKLIERDEKTFETSGKLLTRALNKIEKTKKIYSDIIYGYVFQTVEDVMNCNPIKNKRLLIRKEICENAFGPMAMKIRSQYTNKEHLVEMIFIVNSPQKTSVICTTMADPGFHWTPLEEVELPKVLLESISPLI